MKKTIAVLVTVAVVAAGGWWFVQGRSASAPDKTQTQYVQTPVKRGDVRVNVTGTGPVQSVNGATVRSNQTGTVTHLLRKDGERVKAGDAVLILENKSLLASLKQAQVDVQSNRTSVANLERPQDTAVQSQRLKLENARLTLRQREQDLANLTVTAPAGGVVASVHTTRGSNVVSGALLYTIYDDSEPILVVNLPQVTAAAVRVGQAATVDFPGLGTVSGRVKQTGAAATPVSGNRDANVPVSIVLAAKPGLRAGLVGTVTMDVPGLDYVVQGHGSVKSTTTEVRAQVAGTVSRLAVAEGDRVSAGDLLAQLTSDTLPLQVEQAQNDVRTQEQNLLNLLEPARDPSDQLNALKRKLELSEITLSSRQADVDDLQIKAPVDGQLSAFNLRIGDKVTANQTVFRVADYQAMQVTISVDELDVARVRMGQAAAVTLDALPGRQFKGKVTRINPEGIFKNDIATFEVTVTIDEPQGLMAGMNTQVTITVDEKAGVLTLPAQAVAVKQGKATVQVLENGAPVTKEIQIGLRSSQAVEVTGGLREGQDVILTTLKPATGGFGPFGGGSGGSGGMGSGGMGGGGGTRP